MFWVQADPRASETSRLAMSSSNSTMHAPPAMQQTSAPGFNFLEFLSSQLIGVLLDFMLAGAFFVQLVIYRICFPKDSRAFQILVYGLTLLEIARICLVGYETQDLFAAGYGDFGRLATEIQRQYSLAFSPIVLCIVQHFFSYRIFSLDRRFWPICILISILSLGQCSVGLAWFALFFRGTDPLDDEQNILDDLGRAWYAGGMTTAVINTLTTAFILLRVHAVNQSTQQAVRRIVRFTIESNAASAALEIISLALLQALPNNPYYAATSYLLPGVYSNMLLVTLNYRVLIRKHRATSQTSTLPRAPTVDLEKNRRNTVSAGQRDSATIGAGSEGPVEGPAEGASMRARISDETTGPHLKFGEPDPRASETTRLAMSSSNSTTPDPSATESSSAASFDFAELLSAQLIGALLDFMLGGAFLVQLVIYRICFPKDSRVIQILVYGLALLTLLRIGLTGYQTQDLFAAGFGDVARLATEIQRQYALPLVPITLSIVQHFFSYRIFSLDRRFWPICILISILSLAQCSVGLAGFALLLKGPDPFDDEQNIIDDLGRAWYAGGMTTSLINTLTTAFILLRVRTIDQTTHQAVRRVVRLTIESNAVSTALEIISLALLQAFPDDPYYIGPSYMLPGVYSNMLLVTLNYRALIRQQRATSQTSTLIRAPPTVDLEKNRRGTAPAGQGQRDSATIGTGSVGPAEGGSVRTRISDETTRHHHGPHLKIADVQIRVEEERSVVRG
ncbi:hypothetical protein HMN09_00348000 [Mycena chlorophos]|uniref:DUF6534 domain-containing protein n=1 Tax=Mycena chlorophos TaxID=658473 RepID=A0A8H6TGQ5_MYCCL|nr:hypothetical protein HMN09_00348000 [Mycena chlorophos]